MTEKSREAFQNAILEVQKRQNPSIEPLHLILEVLKQKEGLAGQILDSMAVNRAEVIADLERELERQAKVSASSSPPFPSNDFIQLLTEAEKSAEKTGGFLYFHGAFYFGFVFLPPK